MYIEPNLRSKAAIKRALDRGVCITIYQPNNLGTPIPRDGPVTLEGPHYPEPHKWYGEGTMKDGRLVGIK